MKIKEELQILKKKVLSTLKNNLENSGVDSIVVLDDLVDEFIGWYTQNVVKKYCDDKEEYSHLVKMREFIEKMAVWYELRYPDYEMDRMMKGTPKESINETMFKNNPYINSILDEYSDIKDLDWDEFYNAKVFINSLPQYEKNLFERPKYQSIVYWNPGHSNAHLYLTRNGFVEMSRFMDHIIPGVSNKDIEGKNIKEVVKMFKEKGVKFPENNEFEKAIKDYDDSVYQKEEMLNCVMYRIIERSKNIYGTYRALIFAKEFKRDIDIPMICGIDGSYSNEEFIINEYLKSGGTIDLVCYVGYYRRKSKYENLPTATIKELIQAKNNGYSKEKNKLYERLVVSLANNINIDELQKEQVNQLRLERKIRKSKMNK